MWTLRHLFQNHLYYAEDLGYEYLSASNKDEYLSSLDKFVAVNIGTSNTYYSPHSSQLIAYGRANCTCSTSYEHNIIGEKGVSVIKAIMGR